MTKCILAFVFACAFPVISVHADLELTYHYGQQHCEVLEMSASQVIGHDERGQSVGLPTGGVFELEEASPADESVLIPDPSVWAEYNKNGKPRAEARWMVSFPRPLAFISNDPHVPSDAVFFPINPDDHKKALIVILRKTGSKLTVVSVEELTSATGEKPGEIRALIPIGSKQEDIQGYFLFGIFEKQQWITPTMRLGKFNEARLLFAAGRGNEARVDQLLKAGANAAAVDRNGYSALAYAAAAGHAGIVKRLLERGPTIKRKEMDMAMRAAAANGRAAIVDLLLRSGASPNSPDENKYAPVLLAAKVASAPTVEALAKAKAWLNVTGSSGETPMSVALNRGRGDIAVSCAMQALISKQRRKTKTAASSRRLVRAMLIRSTFSCVKKPIRMPAPSVSRLWRPRRWTAIQRSSNACWTAAPAPTRPTKGARPRC